jgi:hypothetical protein
VRLIGQFDEYLLGYRSRDLILSPKFAKRIQAGGGFVQPAVLVDGYVAGPGGNRCFAVAIDDAPAP